MFNVTKQAFVLSAELSTLSVRENFHRTEELIQLLNKHKLPFKLVEGNYEGSTEVSLYIVAENTYNSVIKLLADTFDQECYLRVHSDGHAELVFKDGSIKSVGKWTPTDKQPEKNYSKVDGLYFITL